MAPREVFLNAGDFFFLGADHAKAPVRVRTLLGSCVSIAMRDRVSGAGGMSHSVLPARTSSHGPFDGNHCEGAMALFLREIERHRIPPRQFDVFLLGGSRMSLGMRNEHKTSIGDRNLDACRTLLQRAGFTLRGEHVGQSGPRRIDFDLASGRIEVRHNNQVLLIGPPAG